jgi:hypothetical protein
MSLRMVNFFVPQSSTSPKCKALDICWTYDDCWDENHDHPISTPCFRMVCGLMVSGALLISVAEVQGRKKKFKSFKRVVLKVREAIEDTIDDLSLSFRSSVRPRDELDHSGSFSAGGGGGGREGGEEPPQPHVTTRDDLEHDSDDNDDDDDDGTDMSELAFATTFRTQANFIKNNTDPTMVLPNAYSVEYNPRGVEKSVLPLSGFFSQESWYLAMRCNLLVSVFLGSAGWAMVCSGFSTWLWILINYEQSCGGVLHENNNVNGNNNFGRTSTMEFPVQQWVQSVGDSMTLVRNDYEFYPVFLLIGYIGYVVHRWREFMVNCHEVQAKLHDVALLCGGAITSVPSREVRVKLFRIYRYINVIHALCYKSVSPTIGPLEIEVDFVRSLRLLEVDEADELNVLGNKKRDAVIGWLTLEINGFLDMEGVNGDYTTS